VVVDPVVDAAQGGESVVVWGMHRMKLVKCPIQECANGSAHAHT
jgi:hypothetical protein